MHLELNKDLIFRHSNSRIAQNNSGFQLKNSKNSRSTSLKHVALCNVYLYLCMCAVRWQEKTIYTDLAHFCIIFTELCDLTIYGTIDRSI